MAICNASKWAVCAVLLSAANTAGADNYAADNTERNVRDRSAHEAPADDQSWQERDVELTRQIRERIVNQGGLSTYAQNIKIITTDDGRVTVKGPVRSEEERRVVMNIVNSVAGNSRVESAIDIVPKSAD